MFEPVLRSYFSDARQTFRARSLGSLKPTRRIRGDYDAVFERKTTLREREKYARTVNWRNRRIPEQPGQQTRPLDICSAISVRSIYNKCRGCFSLLSRIVRLKFMRQPAHTLNTFSHFYTPRRT
jgi:hypothetical protein